jgi:beta-phosphoglucomutase-like phosphatase (HAD superfamily)
MFEAVIFDCDGVLLETEAAELQVELEVLAGLGLHIEHSRYCAGALGCRFSFISGVSRKWGVSLFTRRTAHIWTDLLAVHATHGNVRVRCRSALLHELVASNAHRQGSSAFAVAFPCGG